jgi:hypothetical protein
MYIEIRINEEIGSSHMNLALLKQTDKQLNALRFEQPDRRLAKDAKQEQLRRKEVGYWDGTMAFQVTEDNASFDEEKTTEYVYATSVEKIE